MNQTKQDPATQYADATREELLNELLAAQNQTRQTELRAIKVYQENERIKADPALARQRAQLEHDLEMIDLFVQSGAFVNKAAKKPLTKYECYAIIMCGREMGMQPIESLQTFYIVNGQIKPYGDKMVGLITRAGYLVEYSDMPGFTRQEQLFLAALVGYHRRPIPRDYSDALPTRLHEPLRMTLFCLRFACILCRTRDDSAIPNFRLSGSENRLTAGFTGKWAKAHPLTLFDLHQEAVDLEAIGLNLFITDPTD